MSLKTILQKIQDEVSDRDSSIDVIHRSMRQATRLSKKAILYVHHERIGEAENTLRKAEEFFKELQETCVEHAELVYIGIVDAALQEYAEAHIFLGLVKNGGFLGPEKLGITGNTYVLGLADVIGELRRRTLDSLRKGNLKTAEDCFKTMEEIYTKLLDVNDICLAVSGLRRKLDIARRIIESTRGDVTIELSKSKLEKAIDGLGKRIEKQSTRKKST